MAERVRRTKEEIVADLDKKITYHAGIVKQLEESTASKIAHHKAAIEKLEVKKEATLNPKARTSTRKKGMKSVIDKAKEMGMTPEEIAEKLGITL